MKKVIAVLLALTMVFSLSLLAGCGSKEEAPKEEPAAEKTDEELAKECADLIDAIYVQEWTEETEEQCKAAKAAWDALTDEQALEAVKNYCFSKNPDLKNKVDSGEYNIYWDVTASNADKIVVLFRSYTSAQIRYYIDPISGETYVTELVPGIIDEEQRTEESFNIRDY